MAAATRTPKACTNSRCATRPARTSRSLASRGVRSTANGVALNDTFVLYPVAGLTWKGERLCIGCGSYFQGSLVIEASETIGLVDAKVVDRDDDQCVHAEYECFAASSTRCSAPEARYALTPRGAAGSYSAFEAGRPRTRASAPRRRLPRRPSAGTGSSSWRRPRAAPCACVVGLPVSIRICRRVHHEAGVDDAEQRLLVGAAAPHGHAAAAGVERRRARVLEDHPLGV